VFFFHDGCFGKCIKFGNKDLVTGKMMPSFAEKMTKNVEKKENTMKNM